MGWAFLSPLPSWAAAHPLHPRTRSNRAPHSSPTGRMEAVALSYEAAEVRTPACPRPLCSTPTPRSGATSTSTPSRCATWTCTWHWAHRAASRSLRTSTAHYTRRPMRRPSSRATRSTSLRYAASWTPPPCDPYRTLSGISAGTAKRTRDTAPSCCASGAVLRRSSRH